MVYFFYMNLSGYGYILKWYMYCAYQEPVQTNFLRYYFYFLPDQAQTHLKHLKVLDELWGDIQLDSTTDEEFPHILPL